MTALPPSLPQDGRSPSAGDICPPPSPCPAGGEHVWTDDVDARYERTPRRERIHCDECGASPDPALLREWEDADGERRAEARAWWRGAT